MFKPILTGLVAAILTLPGTARSQTQSEICGEATACTIETGTYNIALPKVDAAGVMVFLHGYGGRSDRVIANTGLLRTFLDSGYAVIAPQGLPFRANQKGGSWNSTANAKRRDDVAFIRDVVADAGQRFDLPIANTVLGGFSGGGMMTWRVACDAPDAFAAYAPIAGLLWRPLPENCAGPVRFFHTHGWSDPVVPLEGRSVGGGILTQGDVFHGLDILRAANRCGRDDPQSYGDTGGYLIRRWTSCADGGWLALALHPGGHTIPKGWGAMIMDWHMAYRASQ